MKQVALEMYADIINKYKKICSKYNVYINVELTYGDAEKQNIIHNTIFLNLDYFAGDLFEAALSYNVRKILLPQLKIETSRLILRRFAKEDAYDCFEFISDEETCLNDGGYFPISEMNDEYNKLMDCFALEKNRYMIYSKEYKKVIGTICLRDVLDRAVQCQEIGYVVSPNYRRKGYAFEAVNTLVKVLLNELNLDMIVVGCFEDNIASKEMIKKLNFIYEGKKHNAIWHIIEGPKDLLYYYKEKGSKEN